MCARYMVPASCAKAELHRAPWPAAFMVAAPDMYCNTSQLQNAKGCKRPELQFGLKWGQIAGGRINLQASN